MSDAPAPPRYFFDYADPICFVQEMRVQDAERATGVDVVRHPVEGRPPEAPAAAPDDAALLERWERARRAAAGHGVELPRPRVAPRGGKAIELALHAAGEGALPAVHDAIWRACHLEGLDIGRVDVLVGIARSCGLDAARAKVVLDVDTHLGTRRVLRAAAERRGALGVPLVLAGGRRLEGLTDAADLRARLTRAR